MELPVAPQSYEPTPEVLTRAIKHAAVVLARAVSQEAQLDGAVAFTNPRLAGVHMANCAADVQVAEGLAPDHVLDQIAAHFAAAGVVCHKMQSAEGAWPAALAQALELRGYVRGPTADLFLLQHYQPLPHPLEALQIIPGRAAYDEVRALCRDAAVNWWGCDVATGDQITAAHISQLDESRLESFLGRVDGRPAGIINVLSLGQVGVIDYLFTAPLFRRRGVGSRLLEHAIDYCRRAQFEQVILEALRDAPACRLYQSIGFRPVASFADYLRR